MLQLEHKLEEIRTICRLHNFPTGRWEDLADLPLRLSQDAGFRSYFVEIVRSLQASHVPLSDALDLIVNAAGGSSAPKHSRELQEYISLLGSFLASIGRWPGDDSRPLLAPGEIPANIQQFTRPQPRVPAITAPASSAPSSRVAQQAEQPLHSFQPVQPVAARRTVPTSAAPQPAPSTRTDPTHTARERMHAERQEAERTPPIRTAQEHLNPDRLNPDRLNPERPISNRAQPERTATSHLESERPRPATLADPARLADRPYSIPTRPQAPDPAPSPMADIAQALARLERGNLELRAHLDSIDQRISRMEPLLETATPPPAEAEPEPEAHAHEDSSPATPVLVHRNPPSGRSFRIVPQHEDPIVVDPVDPEPTRAEYSWPQPPSQPGPNGHPSPSATHEPEPSYARAGERGISSPEAQDGFQASSSRLVLTASDPTQYQQRAPDSDPDPAPQSHQNHYPEQIPTARPATHHADAEPAFASNATAENSATASRKSTAPTPFAPRFSRFSAPPPPELQEAPRAQPPSSAQPASLAAAAPTSSSSALRPLPLPRGFFGTAPVAEETREDSEHTTVPPSAGRRRNFNIIATVLIVLALLAAAYFLYTRSLSAGNDPSGISPNPAPRSASSGPLTDQPASSAAAAPDPSAKSGRVLDSRSSFQPRQNAEAPGSGGSFRPAGNFVPSSVMDGRLLSAPPPDTSHIPSSTRGVVVMEANISPAGQVEDVHILGGSAPLRSPAIDAVRNWQYKPYLVNGSPAEVRTIIRVDFTPHHSQPADRGAPFPP